MEILNLNEILFEVIIANKNIVKRFQVIDILIKKLESRNISQIS